jgi:hypothetical protein
MGALYASNKSFEYSYHPRSEGCKWIGTMDIVL